MTVDFGWIVTTLLAYVSNTSIDICLEFIALIYLIPLQHKKFVVRKLQYVSMFALEMLVTISRHAAAIKVTSLT